jgi:hypothetical protein
VGTAQSQSDNKRSLLGVWSQLKLSATPSTVPQLLVALFFGLAWAGGLLHVTGPTPMMVAAMASGLAFWVIVIVRVTRVPLGNSTVLRGAARFWLLTLAFGLWLALTPPLRSRKWLAWTAWVLVLLGFAALMLSEFTNRALIS